MYHDSAGLWRLNPKIRQHTSAYVSIRQQTSAYVSIRQHTSAYVSIRQHTLAYVIYVPRQCGIVTQALRSASSWGVNSAVWGHMHSSMRSQISKYEDIYIAVWGHIYSSMRTHAQQYEVTNIEVWGHIAVWGHMYKALPGRGRNHFCRRDAWWRFSTRGGLDEKKNEKKCVI
jgi:hypothetical protein